MQEKLNELKGAVTSKIEIDGFEGFKVEINDTSVWTQNIAQLIPLFGKVIFEEFENEKFNLDDPTQPTRVLHQLEISFKDIDYMFVLLDKDALVGLIAMKVLSNEPKVGVVIEMILSPIYRGKKISPKLYDLVYKYGDFYSIISYSKNPAAVHSRYNVGKKFGYETIFGDMPTDIAEVAKLQSLAKEYFYNDGIVSNASAPNGYIFLKGEENVNAPLQADEVKFEIEHPLYKPFQRILEIQKTNDKDTAVGLLVSIKN